MKEVESKSNLEILSYNASPVLRFDHGGRTLKGHGGSKSGKRQSKKGNGMSKGKGGKGILLFCDELVMAPSSVPSLSIIPSITPARSSTKGKGSKGKEGGKGKRSEKSSKGKGSKGKKCIERSNVPSLSTYPSASQSPSEPFIPSAFPSVKLVTSFESAVQKSTTSFKDATNSPSVAANSKILAMRSESLEDSQYTSPDHVSASHEMQKSNAGLIQTVSNSLLNLLSKCKEMFLIIPFYLLIGQYSCCNYLHCSLLTHLNVGG